MANNCRTFVVFLWTVVNICSGLECIQDSGSSCSIDCSLMSNDCSDTTIDFRNYTSSILYCNSTLACSNSTIYGPTTDLTILSNMIQNANATDIPVSDLAIFATETNDITLNYPFVNDHGGFSNILLYANSSQNINIYVSGSNGFDGQIFAQKADQINVECNGVGGCGEGGIFDIFGDFADSITVDCNDDTIDDGVVCTNLAIYADDAASVSVECHRCADTTIRVAGNESSVVLDCIDGGGLERPACDNTHIYMGAADSSLTVNCEASSEDYSHMCTQLYVYANLSTLTLQSTGQTGIDANSRIYSDATETTVYCATYATDTDTVGSCLGQFYLNNSATLTCAGYGCAEMQLYMQDTESLWNTITVDPLCSNCVSQSEEASNCMAMDIYCGNNYGSHATLIGDTSCDETTIACCYNTTATESVSNAAVDANDDCPTDEDFGPMAGFGGFVILGVALLMVFIIVFCAALCSDKFESDY